MLVTPEQHTVIALNGGWTGENRLDTQARVETAVEIATRLHDTGQLGRLIMVGGNAVEMRDYARRYMCDERGRRDLASVDIEYDNSSRDTIGNAHYTKVNRRLDPSTDPFVTIVTVGWHEPRAGWIFSHVLDPRIRILLGPAPNIYNRSETMKKLAVEAFGFGIAHMVLDDVDHDNDGERERRLLDAHLRLGSVGRYASLSSLRTDGR